MMLVRTAMVIMVAVISREEPAASAFAACSMNGQVVVQ